MKTREIPKTSWGSFLETVANCKAFQPVVLRVEGQELGDQAMASGLPLLGISLEEKGSAADAIEVTLSRPATTEHLTHMIAHPSHIWVQENDRGDVTVLDIEDEARVKTLIFFGVWMNDEDDDTQ